MKKPVHPKFKEYMELIVNHPNYKGMPEVFKKDGSIRWVVTPKSEIGESRLKWWNQKRIELGIEEKHGWLAKVARAIHPLGEKPCQICGRVMKLDYVYPTHSTVLKLNREFGLNLNHKSFLTIHEIIDKTFQAEKNPYEKLRAIFRIPSHVQESKDAFLNFILQERTKMLSPGAMSDAPDRLDGFHSYNICCRQRENSGRHPEKMARYVRDRRAFENWNDGDWKATERLIGEFRRVKEGKCALCGKVGPITADHLGPISLGFSLRDNPKLRPFCKRCNSARRYRLSLRDVQELIQDERNGVQVVSWHSRYIWDRLKGLVRSDEDADRLSELMRRNMHHVLLILSEIYTKGFKDFLTQFLHPEFAYQDVRFIGFNPLTGDYKGIEKIPGSKKQYKKSAEDRIDVAFKSLMDYATGKRRVQRWKNREVDKLIDLTLKSLREGNPEGARQHLCKALEVLADDALAEFTQKP